MMSAAPAPALSDPEHSDVRSERKKVAVTPNQTGTMQHTSLREMGLPSALSTRLMTTEVICIPG